MPFRPTRTTGIVLSVIGLAAVIVALILLVRPGSGDGDATSEPTPVSSPSSSAAAAQEQGSTATAAPGGSAAPAQSSGASPTSSDVPAAGAPGSEAPADAAAGTPGDPPAGAPAVDSFSASPSVVACGGDRAATRPVSLSWSSSGGASVFLATGTTDARGGDTVDASASGYELAVACRDAETLVTLTVEGADGAVAHRTLVVTAED